jgi:hypothetical protein
MKAFQMPRFKKYVKKLPGHFQQVILDAVENVLEDPEVGELKKGDLEGFRVHTFTMVHQLTLMAYRLKTVPLFCTRLDRMKIFTGI